MEQKDIVSVIDELSQLNRNYRRDTNDKLSIIRGAVEKLACNTEKAYNQGLKDAWNTAGKIHMPVSDGGYTVGELIDIFGYDSETAVYANFTAKEAMDKIEEYEKREKEKAESETFVRGDVVRAVCIAEDFADTIYEGIYLGDTEEYYRILLKDKSEVLGVKKNLWYITKTGKHVDLDWE